ncbi:hypothetical protein M758_9G127600 [Ceratodon purpureus]|nr:hypothetical protein M758_9G127600 [Ceratodon purpureus]
MAFNSTLWSQLPLEVVEQVLSFLPVPDLCRYCTTCKTWNELINNPAFGMLHVRNRNKHSPFIAIHSIATSIYDEYIDASQVLCFLDISSKKWYSMKPRDALETSFVFNHRYIKVVAMDGGLVLLEAREGAPKLCHHESGCTQLFVWNPIKDIKINLPCVPYFYSYYSLINFVVDDIAETFKVFVMNQDWKNRFVSIYDFRMKEWKASSKVEMNNIRINQSIVFQNNLYILCFVFARNHDMDEHYELWRYNDVADIWERLHFTEGCFAEPSYENFGWDEQLIVSGGRLFVTFLCVSQNDLFEVHEIDIQSRSTKVLLAWSRMQIIRNFDRDVIRYNYLKIHVIGFNKSIMLMCNISRNIVIFDVETKETNLEWPQLPLRKLRREEKYSLMGKQMDFLLLGTLK